MFRFRFETGWPLSSAVMFGPLRNGLIPVYHVCRGAHGRARTWAVLVEPSCRKQDTSASLCRRLFLISTFLLEKCGLTPSPFSSCISLVAAVMSRRNHTFCAPAGAHCCFKLLFLWNYICSFGANGKENACGGLLCVLVKQFCCWLNQSGSQCLWNPLSSQASSFPPFCTAVFFF